MLIDMRFWFTKGKFEGIIFQEKYYKFGSFAGKKVLWKNITSPQQSPTHQASLI